MASDIKKSVLIIGAGPAGLTLAYELLSRSDQFDVTVLEKQEIVGGLAQTYNHKGNRIDIGGHRFFSKDQRVMDRWFAQMSLQGSEAWDYKKLGITSEVAQGGPDPDKEDVVMLARRRLSRIFWNRKFFDYPLSITRDTISKFGLVDLVQSGLSYVAAKFKTYDMTNLEGFYKSRFGERLYDRFFNAYTHKVRGKWPKDISSARGAQRVKGLNLGKAVRDYFKKMIIGDRQSTKTETSLIGKFYYPKLGPGQMREVVAQRVQNLGGKIIFGADFAGGVIANAKYAEINAQAFADMHLLTAEEYLSIVEKEDGDPVIGDSKIWRNDRASIYYYGDAHRTNFADADYMRLKTFIENFVQDNQGKKTIVMIEGGNTWEIPNTVENGTGSTPQFVKYYAQHYGLSSISPEPAFEDEISYIRSKGFSSEEIVYPYVARAIEHYYRNKNKGDIDVFLEDNFAGRESEFFFITGEEYSLKLFEEIHKKLFGTDLDLGDKEHFQNMCDPYYNSRISNGYYYSSRFRDMYISKTVLEYIDQEYNVLIVYGRGHFLAQTRVFDSYFASEGRVSSDNNTLPIPQKTQGAVDSDYIDLGDGIVVTRAMQADVEEAEVLRQAAWVESYGNEELGITSEMIQKRFAGKSEQNIASLSKMVAEGKNILVVKHDNKIIGLKYPPRSDKGRYRIGAIYLLKEYTGKGLGTKLMNISLKDARDKDLYCEVAEYNKNTIQFYERLGFHIEPNEQSQTIEFENGAVLKTIVMKRPGTQNKTSHAIQSISYTKDGQTVTVQPDIVVSTAPIKELMTRFEGADPEVVRLSNLLEYRDFITVGILAKKLLVENTSNHKTINNIIPDNRLYIHDKGTTVGRIQVFNNWSPYMVADPDTIWIGLEYFCDKSDDIWNMSDDKIVEFAVKELESMQLLDKADYLDGVVRRMEYTYPCYFGEGYDKFEHIKTYLDSVSNLYCVGRNGAHRYNNQDHSMLSSMKLADMLISGNVDRSILRSVNTEEEYHEGGKK